MKKRIFYLIPKKDDFRFSVVLGEKAAQNIINGPFPEKIIEEMKNAKKYPEGKPLFFDKDDFVVDTIIDIIKIKMDK